MTTTTPANGQLFTLPYTQPLSVDGKPMPYCYRVFYETNSTTALSVYGDAYLSSYLGNTVTANSAGQFSPIYLHPGYQYRCQLFNAAGQLLEDVDPINTQAMGTPYIAGVVRAATKATTTSRASNTALVGDPDLYVFVPNSGTYKIEMDLVMQAGTAGTTPGINLELYCSASVINTTGGLPVAGVDNGLVATAPLPFNTPFSLQLGTTPISNVLRWSGTLQILKPSGVQGTTLIQLNWGQFNSSAQATSILAGSSLTVTQVA